MDEMYTYNYIAHWLGEISSNAGHITMIVYGVRTEKPDWVANDMTAVGYDV